MDFDQTLKLFDSFWFETEIIFKNLTHPSNPVHQFPEYPSSSSQEYEEEEDDEDDEEEDDEDKDGGNRGGKSKESLRKMRLSELEVEELKGFMDLGFVFPEEDRDPRLVCLIPALQRLRRRNEESNRTDEPEISEPYLSEAWEALEDATRKNRKRKEKKKKKKKNPLMEWRFSGWNYQMNIKDNLRLWAYSVASTVR